MGVVSVRRAVEAQASGLGDVKSLAEEIESMWRQAEAGRQQAAAAHSSAYTQWVGRQVALGEVYELVTGRTIDREVT